VRYTFTVTFESDTMPCKTHRGTIDAPGVPTALTRALKAAKQAFPGARWRSMVVVLEKAEDS
jgi:hypothetical protein